ncbi:peptidase inhibitor family I36 protein [Streptomyces liangshanensis]|uniref:peptidase inhibitor family I36 protein n=1 Tax=Streptomyces liangshanensis TaxID=2717324 RepID=UPI0036D89C3A
MATTAAITFAAIAIAPLAQAVDAEQAMQKEIDAHIAQYGGTQTGPNEISWEGGSVILTFPYAGERTARSAGASPSATLAGGCPTEAFGNDWYCFYVDQNYGGRRLQWNSTHTSAVSFITYGFENQASSWVNGGGKTIFVKDAGQQALWTESPHTQSTKVSAFNDNKAVYFTTS